MLLRFPRFKPPASGSKGESAPDVEQTTVLRFPWWKPSASGSRREAGDDAAYVVPAAPKIGWSAEPSSRRTWIGRLILFVILAIQAALSLRLSNTAYQDEALYLYAGRQEFDHLVHGTALTTDYSSLFSGSPWLYPVLGGAVDSVWGLEGARLLSLVFMLGTCALVYSMSRMLFEERVALCAVAVLAVQQSTIVLGFYATYDASAVFLLALAAWIVVRTSRAALPLVLLAAPVTALAVGVKYASALFVPTIVLLAVICAWPHKGGRRALARGGLLAVATGGLLAIGLWQSNVLAGVQVTTTERAQGTESAWSILEESGQWAGLMFALACIGAVLYVRRDRLNEVPDSQDATSHRIWRLCLVLVLCGSALLAPAYQIYLHTSVSLFKHVGFGLVFAAPICGVGLTRIVGAHFRYPQFGILIWSVLFVLGISQSQWRFATWPDSNQMVAVLSQHVNKTGHYLSEPANVPAYYLQNRTTYNQWTTLYGFSYTDPHNARQHGDAAYVAAVDDGYFNLIVFDGVSVPGTDTIVEKAVQNSSHYQLIARLNFTTVAGPASYLIYAKE